MNGWPIFRDDVVRILAVAAHVTTRGNAENLTDDERVLLGGICKGFDIGLAEVLPPTRAAAALPAASEGDGADGRH